MHPSLRAILYGFAGGLVLGALVAALAGGNGLYLLWIPSILVMFAAAILFFAQRTRRLSAALSAGVTGVWVGWWLLKAFFPTSDIL